MTKPRWTQREDGSVDCPHGNFRLPKSCAKCGADPGPPPEAQVIAPISFPDGCESDEGAWSRLSDDAAELDEDLAFFRAIQRRLYAKPPTPKVVNGSAGERAESDVVLTDEIVSGLVSVGNLIVKLQDAKTKTMRAIIESATEHRRDQRTKQMIDAKRASTAARRGSAR